MAGGRVRPTGTQRLLDTAERISRFDCEINAPMVRRRRHPIPPNRV